MILTERKAHARIIHSMLTKQGITAGEITGRVPINIREQIKAKMKRRDYQVLVANKQIAAEGLDIPSINSIHICFYTSNAGLIQQMIGRGRRSEEGKEYCRVWIYKDFIFEIEFDPFTGNQDEVECKPTKYSHLKVVKWFKNQGFELSYSDEY